MIRREELRVRLHTDVETAFGYLDDFHRLSGHMERSSAMMAGASMAIETDALGGRAVGSHVYMRGRMLGMDLSLHEVVVERDPPLRKAWHTVDARLLVIGQYRLGFELTPEADATRLRLYIDYGLPKRPALGWLSRLLAGLYARWCIRRMGGDAARQFPGGGALRGDGGPGRAP